MRVQRAEPFVRKILRLPDLNPIGPEPRAGFTLIEVLAALVVTAAFVAVVLPFAVTLVTRFSAGQASIDAADGWMQAWARLADDVGQAAPLLVPQGSQPTLAFHADRAVVTFLRPALAGAGAQGLDIVTLRIEPQPSGDRLIRQARPYRGDFFGGSAEAASTATLLEGPYRLRFSPIGADGRPVDEWSDPKVMPLRIDLGITAIGRGAVPLRGIVLPLGARGHGNEAIAPAKAPGQ